MLPVGLVGAECGRGGGLAGERLRPFQRMASFQRRRRGEGVIAGVRHSGQEFARGGGRIERRIRAWRRRSVAGGAAAGKRENSITRDNRAYRG